MWTVDRFDRLDWITVSLFSNLVFCQMLAACKGTTFGCSPIKVKETNFAKRQHWNCLISELLCTLGEMRERMFLFKIGRGNAVLREENVKG